jgi:hypothetical protein
MIKKLNMKKLLSIFTTLFLALAASGQTYPVPEFSNEVYCLRKESSKVVRLEKVTAKVETKTKMGGIGGAENGYVMEGDRSSVRLTGGANISFVFTTGAAVQSTNPAADSTMRANGIDPAMLQGAGIATDPSGSITLYRSETSKGQRKIYLMKTPGMLPFGGKKIKSSVQMGFSVKKIKDGYWELVLDKKLPAGEYIFLMASTSAMGMVTGSATLFAFGLDE